MHKGTEVSPRTTHQRLQSISKLTGDGWRGDRVRDAEQGQHEREELVINQVEKTGYDPRG